MSLRDSVFLTRRRASTITAAGATIVVLSVGMAYAYYTDEGTGTGEGSVVGNSIPLKLFGQVNPTNMGLGQKIGIWGTFKNSNPYSVSVEKVTATIEGIDTPGGVPILDPNVCGPADFEITPLQPAVPYSVAPASGGTSGFWGGPNSSTPTEFLWLQLKNLPNRNQNGCKGVRVSLTYQATTA